MGKSFMLSLSVTFVLVGLLYVFMKQKLANNDKRINSLFGVVQQLAGEIQIMKTPYIGDPSLLNPMPAPAPASETGAQKVIDVSDDSDSDSGSDSESDNSDSDTHSASDSKDGDNKDGGDKDSGDEAGGDEAGGDQGGVIQEIDVLHVKDLIQHFDPEIKCADKVELNVEELNVEELSENIEELSDDNHEIKTHDISLDITPLDINPAASSKVVEVNLDEDLTKLSVKELKARVLGIHGPPLKTKKALIEYIQTKE